MYYKLRPIVEFLFGCLFAFGAVRDIRASRKGDTKEHHVAVRIAGFITAAVGVWFTAMWHITGIPRTLWYEARLAGFTLLIIALVLFLSWIVLDLIRRLGND